MQCTKRMRERSFRFESLEQRHLLAADFLSFSVGDASGDDSLLTAFESSALSVSYDFDADGEVLQSVDLFARQNDFTYMLARYGSSSVSDRLVSLEGFVDFTGTFEFFARATTSVSGEVLSSLFNIEVLPTTSVFGDLTGETFHFASGLDTATIFYGSGGTDTLSLGVNQSSVFSFNGQAIGSYIPNSLVTSQAIYDGTTFDYLRLIDGREIYFQGVERLQFANGAVTELQTRPNDPRFNQQWGMTIADVPDAWRFTRGSDDVLLVSIDTGIPIVSGSPQFSDLSSSRLSFAGAASGSNHGHQAVSVMAATPNNNDGIAGINWSSPVLVLDVYGGDAGNIGINTAINTALSHLDTIPASRIVFQGGIQGEYWLNVLNGGLIPSISEQALFAMAAGNGSQDISIASHPDGLSAGIARLEGTHDNVIAVGALLQNSSPYVHGLENTGSVRLAGYSNYGDNLTFAAPTSTPAQTSTGGNSFFGGTSGANPVMAGYASLVWSIDPSLTAGEVRQILAETAIDVGATGRDPTFGHGVPNAGAAVRRAWALAENSELVNLGANPFSVAPELPGDYNLDGIVNTADYVVWRNALGSTSVRYQGADGDGSSSIDQADYDLWRNNFGAKAPTHAQDFAGIILSAGSESDIFDTIDITFLPHSAGGNSALESTLFSDDFSGHDGNRLDNPGLDGGWDNIAGPGLNYDSSNGNGGRAKGAGISGNVQAFDSSPLDEEGVITLTMMMRTRGDFLMDASLITSTAETIFKFGNPSSDAGFDVVDAADETLLNGNGATVQLSNTSHVFFDIRVSYDTATRMGTLEVGPGSDTGSPVDGPFEIVGTFTVPSTTASSVSASSAIQQAHTVLPIQQESSPGDDLVVYPIWYDEDSPTSDRNLAAAQPTSIPAASLPDSELLGALASISFPRQSSSVTSTEATQPDANDATLGPAAEDPLLLLLATDSAIAEVDFSEDFDAVFADEASEEMSDVETNFDQAVLSSV